MCAFKRFTINEIVLKSLFPSNLIFVFIQSVLHPSCSILSSCRYTKSSSSFFDINIPIYTIWVCSLNGGTPISHPQVLIIFGSKTHGCWVPPWPQLAFPGAASKLLPPKPPAGAACKSVVSCITWQVELSFELGKVGTGPPNHPIFLTGFSITNHPFWGVSLWLETSNVDCSNNDTTFFFVFYFKHLLTQLL